MKTIPPFVLFVIFFALSSPETHGDTLLFGRPHVFSLNPQGGILYGTAFEIVYWYPEQDAYKSELRWDLRPLWYLGLNISFTPAKASRGWGFFTALDFKAGIPMETGRIEDRDWLESAVPGALTHFSSHENRTRAAFLAGLEGGFSFFLSKHFFLSAFLSAAYWYFEMSAVDGYTQYGPAYTPWDPSWEKEAFTGTGIQYFQHWLVLSPGIGLGMSLGRFGMAASFKISPLIACVTRDEHIARKTLFTDYAFGGIYMEPALDVSFAFNKRLTAGLKLSYRLAGGARGNSTVEDYGKAQAAYTVKDAGGAGLEVFDGNLYLAFRPGALE